MALLLCNHAAFTANLQESLTICDKTDECVRIVPTARLQRLLQRKTIRLQHSISQKPVKSPPIFTLATFVQYLAATISDFANIHVVSDAYKLALFEEVVEQSELLYYRIADEHLSLPIIERLKNVVQGLKKDGITPDKLVQDMEKVKDTSQLARKKLTDILTLYTRYESKLQENISDDFTLTNRLTEYLSNNPHYLASLLDDNLFLYISGFTEFSQPETAFLSALAQQTYPVIISVEFSEQNGPLFGNVQTMIAQLTFHGYTTYSAEQTSQNITIHNSQHLEPVPCLRRWLFNTERPINNSSFSQFVSVWQTQDRISEVESIGKLIKYYILKEQIQPGDITIAVRQPEIYTPLFREYFKKLAIPLNITDRYGLAKAPVVSALFSVIDVGLRGWRVRDIRRALSSPYLQFFQSDNSNHETISLQQRESAATIDEVARMLRITDYRRFRNPNQWLEIIDKRILAITALINRWNDAGLVDEAELQQRNKQLSQLEKAKKDIALLIEIIDIPDKQLSPQDFQQIVLNNILNRLQVRHAIEMLFRHILLKKNRISELDYIILEEEVEKDARALAAFIDVLNEFCFVQKQRFPHKKRSIVHYFSRLKSSVHAAKYQIREKHGYGVTITSPEQTRGIPSPISIVCGLIDGEFPQSYKPEQFLGFELPQSEERHIRSERMQFFEWFSNALESSEKPKIHIFLPKSDGNAETIPSPFLDAVLRISTLRNDNRCKELVDIFDAESPAWYSSIASKQEFQLSSIHTETIIEDITDSTLTADTTEKLLKRSKAPISVSALEQYNECPFKFLSAYILYLQDKQSVSSWFNSPDIGNLFHTIVFRFYSTLQKELPPSNLLEHLKDDYTSLLQNIAHEELERLRFDHPYFPIEVARLLGDDVAEGKLFVWLENELQKIQAGWDFIPALFEYSFGQFNKSGKGNQALVLSDKLTLRGKIDRIEIKEHNDAVEFLVTDYKTGNPPLNKDITTLRSLQLPLYIAAANQIIASIYGKQPFPSGALYYVPFAREEKKEKYVRLPLIAGHCANLVLAAGYTRIKVHDSTYLNDVAQQAVELGGHFCEEIGKGEFSVSPKPNACQKCSYQSVCRISEIDQEDTFLAIEEIE